MHSVAGFQPKMESQAVDSGHARLGGGFACKPAGDQQQRIRVIRIHVAHDFLRNFRKGIRPGIGIIVGGDPSHDAEAADEVDVRHLEPVIGEVGVLLPIPGVLMPRKIQLANFCRRYRRRRAQESDAGGSQRVARIIRLRDQKAGACVLMQVLRVHGHAADEEDGPAEVVCRVGHHGTEGKARDLPGMRGQAADPSNGNKRAGALRERRFGNVRSGRSGAGVLASRHAFIVAGAPIGGADEHEGICYIGFVGDFYAPKMNLTTPRESAIMVFPSGKPLGAEIGGVDLRCVSDAAFAAIQKAWNDHSVLLFRRQQLTDDDLIAFSRRFGHLDLAPIQETGRRFVEGYPEIYVVSNVMVNGEPIGSLGAGEAAWHTDMSYLEDPPKASVLYALEVPASGGNTYFCGMYHAYDSLPETLKQRIEGRLLKHDGTYNSGGFLRQGMTAAEDPMTSPGACHPLVCTHPETKRRALYLGRRRNAYIQGLPLAESEALLDQLWSIATREEFAWHNEWEVGDLVLWDNRCTMHRRDPFDPKSRRILHRTQVKGEMRPAA